MALNRRPIPPYSSFVAFETLLRRAGSEPIPARIDKALLVAWGIAAGNESGLITTLKSLGIVDDEGRPTELYREMRLSQPRRTAALRRAAESAYPGLGVPGQPLDDDRLHDYFVEERGLTGQMVDKAGRFYRQFVDAIEHPEASFEGDASKRVTTSSRQSSTRQSSAENVPKLGRSAPTRVLPFRLRGVDTEAEASAVNLTVVVEIAPETSEEDLVDLFRRVRRAWRRSATESVPGSEPGDAP